MDEVEKADGHEEDEVFDAEVVEQAGPADGEASADALADLAGGGAEASASALDAMAEGLQAPPADAIAAAEAREQTDAEDALASLASGEAADGDDDREPAEADDEPEAPGFDFAEGESIHVDPERLKVVREQQRVQRQQWRQKRQQHADRTDSLSFKKTMIPLLLAVGVLLLLISGVTAAVTFGRDVPAEGPTALQEYATPLIVAALPLGLILIGGAVMFHLDVHRIQERQSPSPEPTERDQ